VKTLVLLAVVAVTALCGTAAAADAARWVPGAPYWATEDEAATFLEKGFDFAYCRGIARLGKRGSYSDAEYRRFDCSIEFDRTYCSGTRFAVVKGSRPGRYRMKLVRVGDCF
jgi:hypothetical protein